VGGSTEKHLTLLTSLGRTGTLFIGENASRMIRDCVSYHEADVIVPTGAFNWGRKQRAQGLLRMTMGTLLRRHSPGMLMRQLGSGGTPEWAAKIGAGGPC
jgi:hypothetical protein